MLDTAHENPNIAWASEILSKKWRLGIKGAEMMVVYLTKGWWR